MKFHIPFTIASLDRLKRSSRFFFFLTKKKKIPKLQRYLDNSEIDITSEEYLTISIRSFSVSFFILYIVATTTLVLLDVRNAFLLSFGLASIFSSFIFFSQIIYPKIYDTRRVREMDKNLIPALEDMLIQLTSGIPLFNILVNISASDYGALSEEFKKAVKEINAGLPQIEVLEELGERNTSPFFKRTLWQLSNGMRAGSDISIVIKESIKSLNEEQLLQIQTYGNKLNPLIMFYMLISVIMPALATTFVTIISSMIGLGKSTTTLMFIGLFVFVVLAQIMFLGLIKSVRPRLL